MDKWLKFLTICFIGTTMIILSLSNSITGYSALLTGGLIAWGIIAD